MAEHTLLDQIKGIVAEVMAPVTERLAALEAKAPAADDSRAFRKAFGAPGREHPQPGEADTKAPAYVRPGALGDKPLQLMDAVRFMEDRDEKKHPLLMHVSNELQTRGHHKTAARSVMFPLTTSEDYFPDESQGDSTFLMLLKDCLRTTPTHDAATRDILRQFPDLARKLYDGKALDPLDLNLGGALIPLPPSGDLLELLRAQAAVTRAGAEQIPLPPTGAMQWPRETGATTFYWLGANDTITDSNLATGTLTLSAKRVGGLVKIPNDLLRYGTAAEGVVRRALTLDAALAFDLAALEGEGGVHKPLGITRYARSANNTPTMDQVTLHNAGTTAANGDTLVPEDPAKMIALVEEAPDDQGATSFMMRPLMFTGIANMRADQGGSGLGAFMFPVPRGTMGQAIDKVLAGLPVITTTQVPKTHRKGNATNLTYVLCANWRRMVLAIAGAVELAASEHAGFAADQTWIRAIMRGDTALKYPQSVVLCPTLLIP